jgi:SAM-dependent methyltransferase
MTKIIADIIPYLKGDKLYGDDFSVNEIDSWFTAEQDGYFLLAQQDKVKYNYGYYALNFRHGFLYLPKKRFSHVLGIGSAYGDELRPILSQSDTISILEPSDGFVTKDLEGVPVNYIKPLATGIIPFENDSIDLVTCFGVLHHIPNVSKVVSELYRILKPGGYALIREPIVSMGDWRKPRFGLTKNERGIPILIFREIITKNGLLIVKENKCLFSLTSRLKYLLSGSVYNNKLAVQLDAFLCTLPIWSKVYHAENVFQKLRPMSVFYVLQKPLI